MKNKKGISLVVLIIIIVILVVLAGVVTTNILDLDIAGLLEEWRVKQSFITFDEELASYVADKYLAEKNL